VGEQADIYERITGRIIEQMETASAAGWQKPWITTGQNTLQPVNAATKREYRGVNVLMLWASAEITGYQDGRWATFKQWQQIGAQVRRGETGTPVVFYKELPRRGGDAAVGGPISGQFEGAAAEATGAGTYPGPIRSLSWSLSTAADICAGVRGNCLSPHWSRHSRSHLLQPI
jgi:hypothetical protein